MIRSVRPALPVAQRARRRGLLTGVALLIALLTVAAGLEARVYIGIQGALSAAFPDAEFQRKPMYLSRAQQSTLKAVPGLASIGRFHTFYIARDARGQIIGHALFDTHTVRTKEQTLLIALNPDSTVRSTRVISFFEPQEYLAPDRWLQIFTGKSSKDAIRTGRDLPTISGATLTTRAVSDAVRKAIQLHGVHFSK